MLSGSLKVTPLAALSRFCICCKFSLNLQSSIFVFHKSIFLHLFSINLYSSIFVFQTSSRGEGQDNNCEHAWQQQGEFSPPCYVWMDDSVIFLFLTVMIICNKNTRPKDIIVKKTCLLIDEIICHYLRNVPGSRRVLFLPCSSPSPCRVSAHR